MAAPPAVASSREPGDVELGGATTRDTYPLVTAADFADGLSHSEGVLEGVAHRRRTV